MSRMSNISLGVRVGAAFSLLAGLLLVVAALGVSGGSSQGTAAKKLDSSLRLTQEVMQVKYRGADFNGWQTAYALDIIRGAPGATADSAASRKAFLASAAGFRRELAAVEGERLSPAQRAQARAASSAFDQFMATDGGVIKLYRSGGAGAVAQANKLVLGREITLFTQISSAVDRLVASVGQEAKLAKASANSARSSSRTRIILVSAIAVLLAAAAAFLVLRYIKGSVRAILDRMSVIQNAFKTHLIAALHSLAGGDLTIRLHATTSAGATDFSKDELGQIRSQVEEFRNGLLDCYGAYNETAEKLGGLIGEVTSTAGSVDYASKEMSSTSEETGKATGEIAQAIGDVAQGAERQVQMLETTRRAAEEVVSAVKESAQQAAQTAEAASQAREAAQHGVQAAEQANDAMQAVRDSSQDVTKAIGELATKSEQIGEIVATITGIAEQTNLLALNAAIEAARAGDQGRGFAVVADEVRKLAEESQQAAHEISELIGAIQDETSKAVTVVEAGAERTADGSAVVEQTREAFLTIGLAVDDMTVRIEQIAAGAKEITANATSMQEGMAEIASVAQESSASTEEVSASTEQTSASAQQISASAHELATNAEQLSSLVAQFKIAT